jgi:hypothetical protein
MGRRPDCRLGSSFAHRTASFWAGVTRFSQLRVSLTDPQSGTGPRLSALGGGPTAACVVMHAAIFKPHPVVPLCGHPKLPLCGHPLLPLTRHRVVTPECTHRHSLRG